MNNLKITAPVQLELELAKAMFTDMELAEESMGRSRLH